MDLTVLQWAASSAGGGLMIWGLVFMHLKHVSYRLDEQKELLLEHVRIIHELDKRTAKCEHCLKGG